MERQSQQTYARDARSDAHSNAQLLSLDNIARKANQTLQRNAPLESSQKGELAVRPVSRTHSQKHPPQQRMRLKVQELKSGQPQQFHVQINHLKVAYRAGTQRSLSAEEKSKQQGKQDGRGSADADGPASPTE